MPGGRAQRHGFRGIEGDILDMVNLLQGRDEKPGGVLRVTQPQNVLVDFYPVYEAFLREYPDIRLEVETESTVVNLNQQEAEVANRVTERPPELLVGRRLGELYFQAYASNEYLSRFDILCAVRAGIGASFLSRHYASQFNGLVPVPGGDIQNVRQLWVLTHRDLRSIKRVQCFIRFVGDELAEILQRHPTAPVS